MERSSRRTYLRTVFLFAVSARAIGRRAIVGLEPAARWLESTQPQPYVGSPLGLTSAKQSVTFRSRASSPAAGGLVYIGSGWGHLALWLTSSARRVQLWERGWIGAMRELFERGF